MVQLFNPKARQDIHFSFSFSIEMFLDQILLLVNLFLEKLSHNLQPSTGTRKDCATEVPRSKKSQIKFRFPMAFYASISFLSFSPKAVKALQLFSM